MRAFIVNRAAGDQVRINIRSLANTKAIRKEKRNGRDVIIVPCATLPDDVVMNEILYPADEIEKSFKSLERTPAPLGHPTINGKFVSARDPEGINQGWIGAWNENLRREKGRVFLDKVIDVEIANQSAGGKAVLAAVEKGEAVHTSTGLLALMEAANGDVDYKYIAREIEFDHDAILLNEDGAATPEQGVGMMVNRAGKDIEVVNSSLDDAFDHEIDWAGTRLVEAVRRKADASKWQELKVRILETLGLNNSERSPSNNQKDDEMDKVQFDELSAKVNALSETVGKIGETVATAVGNALTEGLKPLVEAQTATANAAKAKDDEELKGLIDKIVKANLLEEAEAKELTLNAARALAKKAEPGEAAPVSGAFKLNTSQGGGLASYKLPKAEAK
jgi:hypothetical protein